MPNERAPVEVFYSYAHEDEALYNELEKHLSILQRSSLISSWHDRKIEVDPLLGETRTWKSSYGSFIKKDEK